MQNPNWFGMMFEFRKYIVLSLDIKNEKKIHTFFCRTLDIRFYDKDKKLILAKYAVKPFSVLDIPKNTKYVIEMTI